jgi:hypothetical protein
VKKIHAYHVILFMVSLIMLIPGSATATVLGSVHDFSTGGTSGFQSTNEDEVCIFCHTPHGGIATVGTSKVPLWNRTLNLNEAFTMYDSQTFNGDTSYVGGKPTGMSLLCLSCHDGVSTSTAFLITPRRGDPDACQYDQ